MMYNAIIAPFLDYGIFGGSAANIYLDRLFKLQKRAIRIVNHSPFSAPLKTTKPVVWTKYLQKH